MTKGSLKLFCVKKVHFELKSAFSTTVIEPLNTFHVSLEACLESTIMKEIIYFTTTKKSFVFEQ